MGGGCDTVGLHNLDDLLKVLDLFEVVHDDADLIAVVDTKIDAAVENTAVAGDGDFVDVDTELV